MGLVAEHSHLILGSRWVEMYLYFSTTEGPNFKYDGPKTNRLVQDFQTVSSWTLSS